MTVGRDEAWRELPLERFGRALLGRVQAQADRSAAGRALFEFLMFGLKQAWACVFGGAMLALIFLTHVAWHAHAPLARYDAIVIGALAIQSPCWALAWRTCGRRAPS
jgi:hypothetical protein